MPFCHVFQEVKKLCIRARFSRAEKHYFLYTDMLIIYPRRDLSEKLLGILIRKDPTLIFSLPTSMVIEHVLRISA